MTLTYFLPVDPITSFVISFAYILTENQYAAFLICRVEMGKIKYSKTKIQVLI